jgi:hypothetical protein
VIQPLVDAMLAKGILQHVGDYRLRDPVLRRRPASAGRRRSRLRQLCFLDALRKGDRDQPVALKVDGARIREGAALFEARIECELVNDLGYIDCCLGNRDYLLEHRAVERTHIRRP